MAFRMKSGDSGMSSSTGDIQWGRKSLGILGLIMPCGCLTSSKGLKMFKFVENLADLPELAACSADALPRVLGSSGGEFWTHFWVQLPFPDFQLTRGTGQGTRGALRCHCQPQSSHTEFGAV